MKKDKPKTKEFCSLPAVTAQAFEIPFHVNIVCMTKYAILCIFIPFNGIFFKFTLNSHLKAVFFLNIYRFYFFIRQCLVLEYFFIDTF